MAFVTFRSSSAAHQACSVAAELFAESGVHVGPAPRPTDIVWEHLHHDPRDQQKRVLYIVAVMLVMAPVIACTIIIATMFAQVP